MTQVYANRSTVNGINGQDPAVKEKIYQQYLKAYKKGVFNYIKEEVDPITKEIIPRKYFSGGFLVSDDLVSQAMTATPAVETPTGRFVDLEVVTLGRRNSIFKSPIERYVEDFVEKDDQIIGVSTIHPSLGIRIVLKPSVLNNLIVSAEQPVYGTAERVYINRSKTVLVIKQRTVFINPARINSFNDIKVLLSGIFGPEIDFKPWFDANPLPDTSKAMISGKIIFPTAPLGEFKFNGVRLNFNLSLSPQERPDYAKKEMVDVIFRGQSSVRIRRTGDSTGFILSIPQKGIRHRIKEVLTSAEPPMAQEAVIKWDQIQGNSISDIFNSINVNLPPTFPSLSAALPANAPIRYILDLDQGKGKDGAKSRDAGFNIERLNNASIWGVNKRFRNIVVEIKFHESPKVTFSGLRIIKGNKHEYEIGVPNTIRTEKQLAKMLDILLNKEGQQVDFHLKPAIVSKDVDGGIDLTQSNGFKSEQDAEGAVRINFDPAMVQRIRREGVRSVVPVIIRITQVQSVLSLLGLSAVIEGFELFRGIKTFDDARVIDFYCLRRMVGK